MGNLLLLPIIILIAVIFLAVINNKYETFLIQDIRDILDKNPPCLLTPQIKTYYSGMNKDPCSLLSQTVCKMCNKRGECKWTGNKCVKRRRLGLVVCVEERV